MTTPQLTPEQNEALRKQLASGADPKKIGRKKSHRDQEKPIRIPSGACATRIGNTIKLVLPPAISANSYWRVRVIPGSKPRAVTYLSAEAKAYKEAVAKIGESCEPFKGPVKMTARVFRERRAGDLGNFEKVTSDALQGIAFNDDCQVIESHWYLDHDKHNPRIEIEVVAVGYGQGWLMVEGVIEEKQAKKGRKA